MKAPLSKGRMYLPGCVTVCVLLLHCLALSPHPFSCTASLSLSPSHSRFSLSVLLLHCLVLSPSSVTVCDALRAVSSVSVSIPPSAFLVSSAISFLPLPSFLLPPPALLTAIASSSCRCLLVWCLVRYLCQLFTGAFHGTSSNCCRCRLLIIARS